MTLFSIKTLLKSSFPSGYSFVRCIVQIFFRHGLHFTSKVDLEDQFFSPDFGKSQYFFSKNTSRYVVSLFEKYKNICCLCTPRLAHEWNQCGKTVRLLDIDERFSSIYGYQYFDLRNPVLIRDSFDLIITDPPFSLTAVQILLAIEKAALQSPNVTLAIFFPLDREKELLNAFQNWKLQRMQLEKLKWNNIKSRYNDHYGLYINEPQPGT
jgi:hypothetical protein